jgi:hypothetical protein
MIKRGAIICLQIIVAVPTLAAIIGFAILSMLAGLHNEKS